MSYIGDLIKIEISKASDCSYIIVEDVTSYPQTLNIDVCDRSDIGIALFYTNDNWATNDSNLSNSTNDWTINTDNNKTYDVKVFVVPVWSAGTYNDDDMIYKSGENEGFYINDGVSGTTDQIPGIKYFPSTAWTLLTTSDYTTFNTQLFDGSGDYGYTLASEVIDCNLFYSRRTGCHTYTITDNSGGLTINSVTLTDYDNVLVQTLSFGSSTEIALTIEEDGVYIVNINYDDAGGDERVVNVPIFDMCDTETCIKAIIRYIMCKCDDPCDENCNEDNNIERKRNEINKIIALYWIIMGYIYTDLTKYMGAMPFTDTREDYMQQVGRMVEQIKVLTERCGLCEDSENNDCCD